MDLRIWEKKKFWSLALLVLLPGAGGAVSVNDLEAQGYRALSCTFTERCLIGAPCERAWRDWRWMLSDDDGVAYRVSRDGDLEKGLLLKDARWKDYSNARAIIMPLREGIAGQMTMFHDGAAVYSMQYAGGPGSGQFFRGTCEGAG